MTLSQQIYQDGLTKPVIAAGGTIHPLIIPAELTNGTGLMNPSIFIDGDRILVNLRHVNYTLWHSENKKFEHRYGPLQYLHPENDRHLRTWNYLLTMNPDMTIATTQAIDTSAHDVEPIWTFVGLEDARIQRWNGRLWITGVRRDTTTNGQGRMELSELKVTATGVKEILRKRIPAPGADDTYCEKNWMPVLDQPYTYVKWANPTEVVRYDIETGTTATIHLDPSQLIPGVPDFRGGSQVIPYGDNYIALIHEVNLFKSEAGEKDATYKHRFLMWDRDWNMLAYTDAFSLMKADIEFCTGAAWYKNELLLTFGFQDNAAFILKMPRACVDQFMAEANRIPVVPKMTTPDGAEHEFDWGVAANNTWFHATVKKEIFADDTYQRFFKIKPGDVVVDIGASAGPFVWSIVPQQPSRVICLEPHRDLYPTLVKNVGYTGLDVTTINRALGHSDGLNYLAGLYDQNKVSHSDGTDGIMLETIKFSTLVQQQKLTHIDFLKMDCEGGEYDFFTDENREWIHNNVRKIAMEIHLATPAQKEKFRRFRDTYLREFTNFHALSIDYVDIKWSVFDDWFVDHYSAFMLYIDNQIAPKDKKKWQHYPAPTLEITTIIPEKGCVVDCVFCPQRTLEEVYKGTRILALNDYKSMIDKVPTDVRITFAGFTEPWMNKYCTEMVLYAHDQGHPVSVFTTGVGVSTEDMEAIAHIPFAGNPNGGFVLHLPDAEMLARHPITPGYIKTLEWFRDNHHRIKNFSKMSMGAELHPSIRHIFDSAPSYAMWSRAGNLFREAVAKPQLITLRDRWNAITHEGPKTCGCVEGLYHNVLLPNGDVSLCCMDYGLDHIIGNLHEQTYEELIPEDQTCFTLCNSCENATDPKEKVITFVK